MQSTLVETTSEKPAEVMTAVGQAEKLGRWAFVWVGTGTAEATFE
jgi:hypothetical protein